MLKNVLHVCHSERSEESRSEKEKQCEFPRRQGLGMTFGRVSQQIAACEVRRDRRQPALTFLISSIRGGTISKRSPTIPKVAISKIGASLSLLTATMVRAPFMPTWC